MERRGRPSGLPPIRPSDHCYGGGEHREGAVVDDDGLERADDPDLDTTDRGLHDTELDGGAGGLGDQQAGAVTDNDHTGVHAA